MSQKIQKDIQLSQLLFQVIEPVLQLFNSISSARMTREVQYMSGKQNIGLRFFFSGIVVRQICMLVRPRCCHLKAYKSHLQRLEQYSGLGNFSKACLYIYPIN